MKKLCSVEGCDGANRFFGLCESHHYRFKKYGSGFDRSPIKRPKKREPTCTIPGCAQPHAGLGLCGSHYSRLQREGSNFDRSPIIKIAGVGADVIAHALAEATPDQCWEWPLSKSEHGYGWFSEDGKTLQVHRHVCRLAHGPPPSPAHMACHSCDNPPCINKHHLRWDTPQGNIDDRNERDRTSYGSRHPRSKLDEAKVQEIKTRLAAGDDERALAKEFGVSHGAVWFIQKGRTWKHVKAT